VALIAGFDDEKCWISQTSLLIIKPLPMYQKSWGNGGLER